MKRIAVVDRLCAAPVVRSTLPLRLVVFSGVSKRLPGWLTTVQQRGHELVEAEVSVANHTRPMRDLLSEMRRTLRARQTATGDARETEM